MDAHFLNFKGLFNLNNITTKDWMRKKTTISHSHDWQPQPRLLNGCSVFYTLSQSQCLVSQLFFCCPLVHATFLYLGWRSGVIMPCLLVTSQHFQNALITKAITRGREKRATGGHMIITQLYISKIFLYGQIIFIS